jgi:hypothetical protein
MAIRDNATRRSLEAEFQRGFSPLEVATRWQDFGDFVFKVEGYEAVRIPTAGLNWSGAMNTIAIHRRDLQRAGIKLDDWTPPPAPPTQS